MARATPPNILILAENPQTAQQWAGILAPEAGLVWRSAGEMPAEVAPEVIVTDLPSLAAVLQTARLGPADGEPSGQAPTNVGIVGIGTSTWADANLPADVTPREMRLACALVAEIARLRAERTALVQTRDEIKQLAYTDPLTGLPNRRAWELHAPARQRLAHDTKAPLWLAIVDLDGFKEVNTACGLAAGDRVLAGAGQAMAAALRRDDLIARMGGDEFAVLLAGIDETIACKVFDRLRAAVSSQAVPPPLERLSASIGYARVEPDAADLSGGMAAAERALSAAKSAGGDVAMCFGGPRDASPAG